MTARGLEKLKEELRYLKEDKRQELSEYMGAALADGDLRESAAYDEARLLQSANEARIADLEELVHRAVVVEPEVGAEAVARLGASLTLQSQEGENVVFHLVGTHEADILEGRVSDESPLGMSLVGRRAGDSVTVQMPRGAAVYQVLAVSFD
ncbi:MAG: transcription elongation factor GreA [Trueperaceae bacterium]|jgi:transcription elongation factor GreA|nr:transcription elongation factor GreA [Truepera sp.]